jgi:3',5'-nucleoside bisphosphate phosphatase
MEESIYADLHVHTTNSDGEFVLDEIPAAVSEAGIAAVAITDHDRTHSGLNAPLVQIDGIDIIHGIELRVEIESLSERIDLLGYGVTETPALRAELDHLQEDRKTRAVGIIELVEHELDITLDIEVQEGTGRPHIAHAIDTHTGTELSYQDAFDELIGDGGPCYVPREIPPFETGVSLLSEACNVVSLAHPYRYSNPDAVLKLAGQLDAVECRYPYSDGNSARNSGSDIQTVEQHDLLVTGGSDAHNKDLGQAGVTKQEYERLLVVGGFKTADS